MCRGAARGKSLGGPVCHQDYFRSHNLLTPLLPQKLKNTSPKAARTHPSDIFLSRQPAPDVLFGAAGALRFDRI